jgi:hypothetical protein
MTTNNFNWLMHSYLFLHTQRVIKAQQDKAEKSEDDDVMMMMMMKLIQKGRIQIKRSKYVYVDISSS